VFKKLNILLITLVLAIGFVPNMQARTSPPIQACVEGKSVFAVSGKPGSAFRFDVEGGKIVDSTRLDSIVVQWGSQQGLFRIGVQEIPMLGMLKEEWGSDFPTNVEISPECQGQWTYIEVDLRGRPFRFEQPEMTINTGEVVNIPISQRLYKNIRWSDPTIATQGITAPGTHQVWVEDMHGCTFTDTVTVSLRQ